MNKLYLVTEIERDGCDTYYNRTIVSAKNKDDVRKILNNPLLSDNMVDSYGVHSSGIEEIGSGTLHNDPTEV